eukprot:3800341-Rhodomonas_salina.3
MIPATGTLLTAIPGSSIPSISTALSIPNMRSSIPIRQAPATPVPQIALMSVPYRTLHARTDHDGHVFEVPLHVLPRPIQRVYPHRHLPHSLSQYHT